MTEEKHRHFLLTIWLIVVIILNLAKATFCFYDEPLTLHSVYPFAPDWFPYLIGACSLFNILCVLALFKWSIWGFWGYCLSQIIQVFTNLTFKIGSVGHSVMLPFALILILYFMLHIGGKNKGWDQLKY